MLRSGKKLIGFAVHAIDGKIGEIRDFIFDEKEWIVRYAEVDIGNWVSGKVVLLSSMILGPTALSTIDTKLTIGQIEKCPTIDPHIMPTRKYEEELHNYFDWNYYWAQQSDMSQYQISYKLQRIKAIKGFRIKALDGEIGHLDDLLIDDIKWNVRYCVVNTGSWLPGKKVLVSPSWGGMIDDSASEIQIDVKQEKIRTAPQFEPSIHLTSEYEVSLFTHYDKKPYWSL